MMNKRGFTFVELIAVITIIGILALITLPTIEKITKENNEKVYQQQLDNIVLALKSWASDNRINLPEEENETLTITLGNLKIDGYIEYEVKNPLTGKCFDNNMALLITRIKKNYNYSIDLNTIKDSEYCDFDIEKPMIALNGNMIENVEVNSIYVDKGVIAKDKQGNDITEKVSTIITGSGNIVDTSKIGNQYIITYSVTSDGKTSKLSRTVKIVDTTAPQLVIPSDIAIEPTVTTLDIMEGVSATDNSGEVIDVKTKGNISFGRLGKYTITYTAIDSSGNKVTKKRIITVDGAVNGIMSSGSLCINDSTIICPSGTLVSVQVNKNQTYDFYVIKDTGSQLTLIMNRNIGNQVAWVSKLDYKNDTNYGTTGNNNKGPITALNYLNSETSNWTNIPAIESYRYDNNLNGTTNKYGYQKLEIGNGLGKLTSQDGNTIAEITGTSRARLLTYEELTALITANSGATPKWLYTNLSSSNTTAQQYGYWLLTAEPSLSSFVYFMYYTGSNNSSNSVHYDTFYGVRPVIELSK